jgi:hypothetical protein
MKVLSQLQYMQLEHGTFHENSGEVCTVPEDTLSMREIYNRFRNGEPLEVNLYDPLYSDNEYQDIDLDRLDPVEVLELTQKYNEIRKKHEENEQRRQELEQLKLQFKESQVTAKE